MGKPTDAECQDMFAKWSVAMRNRDEALETAKWADEDARNTEIDPQYRQLMRFRATKHRVSANKWKMRAYMLGKKYRKCIGRKP